MEPSKQTLDRKICKCKLIPVYDPLEIKKVDVNCEDIEAEMLAGKTENEKEATIRTLKFKAAKRKALQLQEKSDSIMDNFIANHQKFSKEVA